MNLSKPPGPSRGRVVARREIEAGDGYTISGPGFYVWREHHSEALHAAAELAGSLTVDQARRLAQRERSGRDPEGSD